MLFFEDGTVSAGSIGGNMDTGTWHMVDGVLSISDSYGETQVFDNVEITENTLVLESMESQKLFIEIPTKRSQQTKPSMNLRTTFRIGYIL